MSAIGRGKGSKIQKKYCHRLWMVPMVKKLCKSKNLSNHRVVMLKNPLQVTCDLQRVFQQDHSVIWQVFWDLKEITCHPAKGFSVGPLCVFTRFFIRLITFMNFHLKFRVFFRTNGFAIWEWFFGMGTILASIRKTTFIISNHI